MASRRTGRHPLPSLGSLQAAARRWGLREGDSVVAYDDNGNLAAARLWWLLRWAGFDDVRLLDGGLAAWVAAGGTRETDDVAPELGNVTLGRGHLATIDIGRCRGILRGAARRPRDSAVCRWEVELIDPKAGHIPGSGERAHD